MTRFSKLTFFSVILLLCRLAASYSQLVEYYLSKCEDVDKRLEWQVKDVVWKGE